VITRSDAAFWEGTSPVLENHLAGAWIALLCVGMWEPALVMLALDAVLTLGRKTYEQRKRRGVL
jgi:hypothetical protein